jgi:copper homeostasis protein (lipoprotein)
MKDLKKTKKENIFQHVFSTESNARRKNLTGALWNVSKGAFAIVSCTVAMAAMTLSCTSPKGNAGDQNAETAVADSDSIVVDLAATAGTYEGTIPAADGAGTKMVLTINADSTYSWTADSEDKGKFHDEASGIYTVLSGKVLMLVRPSTEEHTFYKVKDSTSVVMTDSLGNEPTGEMAKFYVLTKK